VNVAVGLRARIAAQRDDDRLVGEVEIELRGQAIAKRVALELADQRRECTAALYVRQVEAAALTDVGEIRNDRGEMLGAKQLRDQRMRVRRGADLRGAKRLVIDDGGSGLQMIGHRLGGLERHAG